MSCPVSPAMIEARRLVTECGFTQYRAAQVTGLTRGAISKAAWYRAHMVAQREQK